MKPYKGRKKRIKSFLFDTFVTIVFLFAFILIALQFGNPSAAGPERVDFSDYPIIALEQYIPNPADVTMLAKLICGEARGIESQTEQAAVVWTVLNRVDSTGYGMGKSIMHVVTFKGQFHGYSPCHPTVDDYGRDLKVLASEVLTRWYNGERALPIEYLWFSGNGTKNVFRDAWRGGNVYNFERSES